MLDRRRLSTVLGTEGAILAMRPAFAEAGLPKVVASKDLTCGCCTGWADHIRAAGLPAEVRETPDINLVKVRLGVPDDVAS